MRLAGRPLVAGAASGRVLYSDDPLSFWGGYDQASGEIIDRRHALSGTLAAGTVLTIPASQGSSTTAAVFLEAVRRGTAPAAIVLEEVDRFLVLAAIIAEEMYGITVPVVALPGAERVRMRGAAEATIHHDGAIECGP